ncbi:hypothetical protein V2H45_24880 [Tumidithrix elongata RA019]|uniref:AA1-like domain-containing protein n=1 Tax=Tumidithrix elongata BACA0141 TaxID=2716417 RepID=A0AAW9QC16_9CYAN|nr:hypothetical protein [Tumidithrix elongata RA019]
MRFFPAAVLATAFALPVSFLSASSAFADRRDFTFVNKTSQIIVNLYVSDSGSNDWEEDVLGRDTLSNGDYTNINFNDKTHKCSYDVKVVFSSGQNFERYGLDLCSTTTYTLYD